MKFFTLSLLIICLFFISACGFSPLYGKNSAANNTTIKSNLSAISIAIIPNREGQFLRNALIDNFYIDGYPSNPQYNLSFSPILERISDFDITINSEATRRQLRLTTNMVFSDAGTNNVLLKRSLSAITSYNVLESEYSTVVTEQSAREAALNDLARQIEQQLSLYLNR